MDKKRPTVIYVRESAVQSVVSDAFMYGGIIGLLYFNHRVLNGSGFLDFIFIMFMLLSAMSRMNSKYKRFNTVAEAKTFINKQEQK